MTILITGCAGFIGSHLLEKLLLTTDHKIIGIDDFSTGSQKNLDEVCARVGEKNWQKFKLRRLCLFDDYPVDLFDVIIHLAAHGSVPKSIKDPKYCFYNNVRGTYNILEGCRYFNSSRRVVIASSSSVYGTNEDLIKTEANTGQPLSPYAATKQCCESLAQAYWHSYGIETICLRFFNVFGPRQNPNGPYAAVIPKWINLVKNGKAIEIFGDGEQSRDFTYVDNVVDALIKAGLTENEKAFGKSINIATGKPKSLMKLAVTIFNELKKSPEITFLPERKGDIKDSCADISLAHELINYEPSVYFENGIKRTVEYYNK